MPNGVRGDSEGNQRDLSGMTEGSKKQANCDGEQLADRNIKDDRAALAGKAMHQLCQPVA